MRISHFKQKKKILLHKYFYGNNHEKPDNGSIKEQPWKACQWKYYRNSHKDWQWKYYGNHHEKPNNGSIMETTMKNPDNKSIIETTMKSLTMEVLWKQPWKVWQSKYHETTMKSLQWKYYRNSHEKPANGNIIETAKKSLQWRYYRNSHEKSAMEVL